MPKKYISRDNIVKAGNGHCSCRGLKSLIANLRCSQKEVGKIWNGCTDISLAKAFAFCEILSQSRRPGFLTKINSEMLV